MKILYNENCKIIENPSTEDYLSILSFILAQKPITIRSGEMTISVGPEDINRLNQLLGVATKDFEAKVLEKKQELKSQTKRFAAIKPHD